MKSSFEYLGCIFQKINVGVIIYLLLLHQPAECRNVLYYYSETIILRKSQPVDWKTVDLDVTPESLKVLGSQADKILYVVESARKLNRIAFQSYEEIQKSLPPKLNDHQQDVRLWINLRLSIAETIQKIFERGLTHNNEPLFSHCKVATQCDICCPIYSFRWLAETFRMKVPEFWLMVKGKFNEETKRWEQPKEWFKDIQNVYDAYLATLEQFYYLRFQFWVKRRQILRQKKFKIHERFDPYQGQVQPNFKVDYNLTGFHPRMSFGESYTMNELIYGKTKENTYEFPDIKTWAPTEKKGQEASNFRFFCQKIGVHHNPYIIPFPSNAISCIANTGAMRVREEETEKSGMKREAPKE